MGGDVAEQRACLALAHAPGIGPVALRRLIDCFGSASAALSASLSEWEAAIGPSVKPPQSTAFVWADAQLERVSALCGDAFCLGGETYPYALSQIHDPPPVLFCLGKAEWERPAIGIVGTRHPSPYGEQVARELAFGLARAGVCVLSGLALGIDAAAHRGALEAGGATVAVMGSGVDTVYPRSHTALYRHIVEKGAVVSEQPMGAQPDRGSFPRRNRIISGLARGVVVVEAAARSGALITARCAAEQGREVFAVPGEIFRASSAGCHALLKDGAKLVECVDDILDELNPWRVETPAPSPAPSGLAGQVYALLGARPLHIDQLASGALSSAQIAAALLELELDGWVAQYEGQRFARRA